MGWRKALPLAGAMIVLAAPGAQAATELSTSDRLQDRREIAAGTRANVLGFADGRFYANGWHIHGEMGGVWTTPMKMLDGVWFGVDGQWAGPATKFTSGHGYVRYDLPSVGDLQLSRTDFVPDGRRAALFGLQLTNPGAAERTATVKVDAHSELMGAWPWGTDPNRGQPDASNNLPDKRRLRRLVARVHRRRVARRWRAGAPLRGARRAPTARRPPARRTRRAATSAARSRATSAPTATARRRPAHCDDGPYGQGTGGELRYSVKVPAHGSETLWVAAAGSDQGLRRRAAELAGALRDPARRIRAQEGLAAALARWSRVSLPGDPLLAGRRRVGQAEPRRLTQTAENLQIRWTDQGKTQFPAPLGHRTERHVARRRLPGLPVAVRHRRRVHGVRGGRARPVRGGQGAPARAARRLRRAEQPLRRRRPRGRPRRLRVLRARQQAHQPDGTKRTTSTRTRSSSSRAPSRSCGAGRATTASATRCTTSRSATCIYVRDQPRRRP